jgi:hypothetical protein
MGAECNLSYCVHVRVVAFGETREMFLGGETTAKQVHGVRLEPHCVVLTYVPTLSRDVFKKGETVNFMYENQNPR